MGKSKIELELKTKGDHNSLHNALRGRDSNGRFLPKHRFGLTSHNLINAVMIIKNNGSAQDLSDALSG